MFSPNARKSLICIWLVLLVCLGWIATLSSAKHLYVHVVGHSHCVVTRANDYLNHSDPGWLNTFEGYYTSQVNQILDNVFTELHTNPKRTFTWAEISFFSRWFDTQPSEKQDRMKALVASGRFEFVAGGWVQNDEANANFDIVVDQVTEGHEYVLKHFGVKPKVAWQIDPFGHSSLTPSLFAQMGFDALVINRIHHHTKDVFKSSKHMEFVWRGSHSLKNRTDILTHVLHTHYSAPRGFDWEEASSPVNANSVQRKAEDFLREMRARSDAYKTNHVMCLWGDDFKFRNARYQFDNMDTLVEYINSHTGLEATVLYSTPGQYFKSLHDAARDTKVAFPLYIGDFFPYADNDDSYWTGYYTTRPTVKSESRRTDTILRSAEASYALAKVISNDDRNYDWKKAFAKLQQGRRDASLVQHHDGITGTAKGFVAGDYLNRLGTAVQASKDIMGKTIPYLMQKKGEVPSLSAELKTFSIGSKDGYAVVFFNSLSWARTDVQFVRVKSAQVKVVDSFGKPAEVQLNPALDQNGAVVDGEWLLYILVDIPAMGASTYFVLPSDTALPITPVESKLNKEYLDSPTLENDYYKIQLATSNGMIQTIENKKIDRRQVVDQQMMFYRTHRSGAYIFRSENRQAEPMQINGKLVIMKGKLLQQATLHFNQRKYTVNLYTAAASETEQIIEQRWVLRAETNEELITRYSTAINSSTTFYTDNGIEMVPRKRKTDRPPHANYFPTPSTCYIEDDTERLTVFGTYAVGTSSLSNGQLENMMHRNLGQDDGRGLGEPNYDGNVIEVTTWLMLDSPANSIASRRKTSLSVNHPVNILYGEAPEADGQSPNAVWARKYQTTYSAVQASFPENLHILSLKTRDSASSEVVLRLLHMHESDEGINLAKKTRLDVGAIFRGLAVSKIRETGLSLHFSKEEMLTTRWQWANSGPSDLSSISVQSFTTTSQNAAEQGVFISQNALELNGAGRTTLSVDSAVNSAVDSLVDQQFLQRRILEETWTTLRSDDTFSALIEPSQILTYLAHLQVDDGKKTLETTQVETDTMETPGDKTFAQHTYIEGREGKQNAPPLFKLPIYRTDYQKMKDDSTKQEIDEPTLKKTEASHNVSHYEVNGMLIMYLAGLALLFAIYQFLRRGVTTGKPRPGSRALEMVSIDSGMKLH